MSKSYLRNKSSLLYGIDKVYENNDQISLLNSSDVKYENLLDEKIFDDKKEKEEKEEIKTASEFKKKLALMKALKGEYYYLHEISVYFPPYLTLKDGKLAGVSKTKKEKNFLIGIDIICPYSYSITEHVIEKNFFGSEETSIKNIEYNCITNYIINKYSSLIDINRNNILPLEKINRTKTKFVIDDPENRNNLFLLNDWFTVRNIDKFNRVNTFYYPFDCLYGLFDIKFYIPYDKIIKNSPENNNLNFITQHLKNVCKIDPVYGCLYHEHKKKRFGTGRKLLYLLSPQLKNIIERESENK